jgi:hypothetical protein
MRLCSFLAVTVYQDVSYQSVRPLLLDDGGEWNPPCCGGYANFEADGNKGGCEGVVGEAAE